MKTKRDQIICFNFRNSELLEFSLDIRRKVFVMEQNVDPEIEFDNHDKNASHYLLFSNSTPVATARLRKTASNYKLERFAVLKEFRNKQYGKQLMHFILSHHPEPEKIYFHSQLSAVGFYEKFGFSTKGKLFFEADIAHYKMVNTNLTTNGSE